MSKQKDVCRLCYYETADTVNVFSEKGIDFDYEGKINKYLYLSVSSNDDLPKTICWMCTQHLETFHKFYEKINEIQKSMLNENYEQIALKPQYVCANQFDIVDVIPTEEKLFKGETQLFEVLIVSDDLEAKAEDQEDGTEEFELLEVENSECNSHVDDENTNDSDNNQKNDSSVDEIVILPAIKSSAKSIDGSVVRLNKRRITPQSPTKIKSPEPNSKRKLRSSIRKEEENTLSAKNHRQTRKGNIETAIIPARTPKSAKRGKETHDEELNESQNKDIPIETTLQQEADEGESDNEFPARDSDNDDWPAPHTLDEFPKELIKNGLLLVKGKQLMSLICKFYKLKCELCEDKTRFRQLTELFEHYLTIHEIPGYVTCCQTKLTRHPAIIMHMARHLQPEAFKCDECGYVVTRPRFLKSHKTTHLPENEKPYGCDQCPRRFCWKGALQIHLISHQPVDERRLYVCHVCGKVYDTPGGLSTHKKLIHSNTKKTESNVCHVCAKNFATRTGLNEHMSSIHQPREKDQLQCSECNKWLMNIRCLKSHMILHSDVQYECDQCDYITKKKVLLNRHRITKHSDEKPFVCDLCGRAFKLKRALAVHLEQHESTKTYKCPFCVRVFNSSTNFYTHRKNAHPEELAKMKRQEQELQRHKRIKAGVEDDSSNLSDSNAVII